MLHGGHGALATSTRLVNGPFGKAGPGPPGGAVFESSASGWLSPSAAATAVALCFFGLTANRAAVYSCREFQFGSVSDPIGPVL